MGQNAGTIQKRVLLQLSYYSCGYYLRAGIIQERVVITRVR